MTIRVLRLGDSKDTTVGEVPVGERASDIADAVLATATGEVVETTTRQPWPSPAFPDVLDRWLDQYSPDLVMLGISWYWTEWETVATRLRRYGTVGRTVGAAGQRAAANDGVRRSWAFRQARKLALTTVGGEANFDPHELAANLEEAMRRVVRREDVVLTVVSNPFASALDHGPRSKARGAERRAILEAGLREACARLRVHAVLPPQRPDAYDPRHYGPDRLHFGPATHRLLGEMEGRAMVDALEAFRR